MECIIHGVYMKISIVCVGKIKEKFYRDAIDEYLKRLSRYCKTEILEVQDEKTPDNASEAEELLIKKREGEKILSKIKDDAYVITLEILGKKMDSVSFANVLEKTALSGKSHIQFVIGGSLGLSKEVKAQSDYKLSFSKMTFPHQLMRVILLEQIYRSYRIINNEPYHK